MILQIGMILLRPHVQLLEGAITFRVRLALPQLTTYSYKRISIIMLVACLRYRNRCSCRLTNTEIFLFPINILRAVFRP